MFSSAVTAENGKQAIKTAIAGVAAMYLTRLFHLPQGYWAAISALIVMQSNVGATLSASRTRLAGTAVGAVVGGAFMALLGDSMLDFALAVAVAFFLCFVLRLPDSQRLAIVTVAIIMLIAQSASAWVVALHRFVEVSIGILIALVVSLTLWPNHARRSLRQGLAAALVKLGALYQAVIADRSVLLSAGSDSLEALNAQISDAFRKNADLLDNALQEAFGPTRERESWRCWPLRWTGSAVPWRRWNSRYWTVRRAPTPEGLIWSWSNCIPVSPRLSDRSQTASGPASRIRPGPN
jgi:uncharacterized membrane protein YccC